MNIEERNVLEILDKAFNDIKVKPIIDDIVDRVESNLNRDTKTLITWEPIPFNIFDCELPSEIKSSWVFVLRKNSRTIAERHPNSIQRMMAWRGKAEFQTKLNKDWESHFLESGLEHNIEKRWLTIPENTWHQGIIGDENWVVVSFQTAEVSDLIEETAENGDESKLIQHRYADM